MKPASSSLFRTWLRRLRQGLLWLVLLVCLAGAGLFFWLQTGQGGDWLAGILTDQLRGPSLAVQVEQLRLKLPVEIRAGRVAVSSGPDRDPWLELDGIRLGWNPMALVAQRELVLTHVEADRLVMSALPEGSGGRERDDQGAIQAVWPVFDLQRLAIDSLEIREQVMGRPFAGSVQGRVSGTKEDLDLAGSLSGFLPDPVHLQGRFEVESQRLQVGADISQLAVGTNRVEALSLAGDLQLARDPLSGHLEGAVEWNGLPVQVTGDWKLLQESVGVTGLVLRAAGGQVAGHGTYSWKEQQAATADLEIDLPDVQALMKWVGWSGYAGSIQARVRLRPEESRLAATATVTSPVLLVPYAATEDLEGTVHIEHVLQPLDHALEVKATAGAFSNTWVRSGRAELDLVLRPDAEQRVLDLQVEAQAFAAVYVTAAVARVDLEGLDLQHGWPTNVPLRIRVEQAETMGFRARTFAFDGASATGPGLQPLPLSGDMEAGGFEGYGVSGDVLRVQADWSDLRGFMEGEGAWKATGTQLAGSSWQLQSAALQATGKLSALATSVEAVMTHPIPLETTAQATLDLFDGVGMDLETAEIQFEEHRLALLDPVAVQTRQGSLTTGVVRVAFDEAVLAARGELATDRIQLTATLDRMALAQVPYMPSSVVSQLTGFVQAELDITGDPARPRLAGSLILDESRPLAPNWPKEEFIEATIHATWEEGAVTVDGTLGVKDYLQATGRIERAAILSLVPFEFEWPKSAPLEGALAATVDLALVNRHPAFAEGRIAGQVVADLTYAGIGTNAQVQGVATVQQAAFEYYPLGVAIKEFTANIHGGEGRLLTTLEATDGGAGRFVGEGEITLSAAEDFPYRLELDVRKATLLRTDMFDAVLSGRLKLERRQGAGRFDGTFKLEDGRVRIDALPPPAPPLIRPIPDPQAPVIDQTARMQSGLFAGALSLDIPGTLLVRGHGLDSVWQGQLLLEGGETGLQASGELQPRRGSFQFLSRRFTLSQGRVWFAGGWPPTPYLDLTAEVDRNSVNAWLKVQGRLDRLNLVLGSDPAMPQDEILSQILFGRDVAAISGLQALQLAAATRTLAHGTSGPGLLDQAKNRLGVDMVELQEMGEGETSEPGLVIGKQVNERLYLQVDRSLNKADGTVTAEYELRPNLNLEVRIGAALNQGVGFNWKKSY